MFIDKELYERITISLGWLVAEARHRFDECKQNVDEGSSGGYSPELTQAIDLVNLLKLKAGELPYTERQFLHTKIYTQQQCLDAAMTIGKTENWGTGYYVHYASQHFLKANGQPISDLRLHMMELKRQGIEYGLESKSVPLARDKDGLTARERDIQQSGK
jgi:hypothetical protein